jgi:regulator of RNase E activity RraA
VFEESTGHPVTLAGVSVSQEDFVLADGSGVVVVPRSRALDVIAEAERLNTREQEMAARLEAGEPAMVVLGHGYESMIGAGEAGHD